MKEGIMMKRKCTGEVTFVIACGCGGPEHDWEMRFTRPSPRLLGYMEIEVDTHDESGYDGLWRRIQKAYRLVFHRWDDRHTTFVLGDGEIAAFESALALTRQFWEEEKANSQDPYSLSEFRAALDYIRTQKASTEPTAAVSAPKPKHRTKDSQR